MATRPPPDQPDDDAVNDGSTAFVRVEDLDNPRGKSAPLAPRKGLQVQLPDEEPAPAPKSKPKLEAAPPGSTGRRGNWWDKSQQPAEEPPEPAPEDSPGATAFLRAEPPKPPPRRKAPVAEAPVEDNRTQFFRPDEAILQRDIHKERPPPPPQVAATPWKLLALILGVSLVVVLLGVALVYREAIFTKKPARPSAPGRSNSER